MLAHSGPFYKEYPMSTVWGCCIPKIFYLSICCTSSVFLHLFLAVAELYHTVNIMSTFRFDTLYMTGRVENSRICEVFYLNHLFYNKMHKLIAENSTYKKQKCPVFCIINEAFLFYAVKFSISEVSLDEIYSLYAPMIARSSS